MTHTTSTGARMATLLTTAQRDAMENALLVPGGVGYALDAALEAVFGGGSRNLALYLLAADARIRNESISHPELRSEYELKRDVITAPGLIAEYRRAVLETLKSERGTMDYVHAKEREFVMRDRLMGRQTTAVVDSGHATPDLGPVGSLHGATPATSPHATLSITIDAQDARDAVNAAIADASLRAESPPPTALTVREKWLIWTAYIAGIDATPEQRFHDDAGFALWLGDAAQLLAAAPAVSA